MAWTFERGDGRYKHRWTKDEAGFVQHGSDSIGKCHSSITQEVAQGMLNQGVPYKAPGATTVEHIYTTYRGVIYEAAPTQHGVSFHGYPWRGGQGRPALPSSVLRTLRDQAQQQCYLKEFEQWLKLHSA